MDKPIVIAVDAMGGDGSPEKIIEGIEVSLDKNTDNHFLLFGNKMFLDKLLNKNNNLKKFCEVIHCEEKISDHESPLVAAKKGKKSSMWSAIEALKNNKADIVLSAGNTGALLVLSRLILNTLEKIEKPALAGLWPNKKGTNIVLDLGANIGCDDKNLISFCSMGSALFKSLFSNQNARVALLNVGLEEIKGNENLKKAFQYLKAKKKNNFEFIGYIEGNQIMDGEANVIVTDGFTGNIALKTAEGTANFFSSTLKEILNKNLLSKIGMLFSITELKKFKKRLDPRKYNGAILLGLNAPIVKSHGSTDALGFSFSIEMCNRIIRGKLIEKIKSNLEEA